jgi:hypothetical protein
LRPSVSNICEGLFLYFRWDFKARRTASSRNFQYGSTVGIIVPSECQREHLCSAEAVPVRYRCLSKSEHHGRFKGIEDNAALRQLKEF